jgi:DAACS family dicarboxylate/amino acid:cation (Na+ or H+) symporter
MLVSLVAGAGLGLGARAVLPENVIDALVEYVAQPVGQIFLRLLFVLVVPLLFSALVVGVADVDLDRIKQLGKRTLGYTVVVSLISVVVGLVLVNVIGPGRGLDAEILRASKSMIPTASKAPPELSPVSILVNMVPANAVAAAAEGDMLGLIVFSLMFGIALAVTPTDGTKTLKLAISGLYDASMTWIDAVLRKVAPFGVAALVFVMTARIGATVLLNVAQYVGVVVLGLAIQMFVVYSLSVSVFGGRSPLEFFRASRVAIVTAFSTASSNATLPTAIKVAEEDLKLPSHVARFVLTAGSAMNQNGTALFEGVTVLFLAQVAGVELPLAKQGLVMLICVLAGIGTAGVPAGSLPVIAMILGMLGVPPEGLGLIVGVDRFLDMCRTTINVTGDLAAAVYVARGEPHEQPSTSPAA